MSDNFFFDADGGSDDERDPPITAADFKKRERSKHNKVLKK